MTDNPETTRTEAVNEAATALTSTLKSFSRLAKTPSPGAAATNSTCSSTTESASTLSSSASSYADPKSNLIRLTVAKTLQGASNSRKLKQISCLGKSIKFPVKLMYLLEECKEFESIISWAADGLSFIIHDTKKFEEQVLPKRFKETKYNSFLRKLYRWGFMKKSPSKTKLSYIHQKFQRGNFSLCMEMCCNSQTSTNSKSRNEFQAARFHQTEGAQSTVPITATSSYHQVNMEIKMLQVELEKQKLKLLRQQLERQTQSDTYLNKFLSEAISIENRNNNMNSNMMPELFDSNATSPIMFTTPLSPSLTVEDQLQLQLQQQSTLHTSYAIGQNNITQNKLCLPINDNYSVPVDPNSLSPAMPAMYQNQNSFASTNGQVQNQYQYPQLQPHLQSQTGLNIQETHLNSNKDEVTAAPDPSRKGIVRRGGNFY